VLFKEIRDVEECIAFQAQIDERRLHSWKDTRYPAFVDAACERIFISPLKIDLDKLIVFKNCYFCFVAIGSNHQLLTHFSPPSGQMMRVQGTPDLRRAQGLKTQRLNAKFVAKEAGGDLLNNTLFLSMFTSS
jgi:hypothetical protein